MTGLEALKIVDNAIKKYSGMSFNLLEANAILSLENSLKALEIIKKKNVDIYQIKYMETLDDYNSVRGEEDRLTEEEFNLLKEVLE